MLDKLRHCHKTIPRLKDPIDKEQECDMLEDDPKWHRDRPSPLPDLYTFTPDTTTMTATTTTTTPTPVSTTTEATNTTTNITTDEKEVVVEPETGRKRRSLEFDLYYDDDDLIVAQNESKRKKKPEVNINTKERMEQEFRRIGIGHVKFNKRLHGFLEILAFLVFIPLSTFPARYFKETKRMSCFGLPSWLVVPNIYANNVKFHS